MIDFKKIKKDFPIFGHLKELIYFDSAATTQKPQQVINALNTFYSQQYGTVHRGVYDLSVHATELYDAARQKVAKFLNAKSEEEIVFTRGTTDSINLVARSLAENYIRENDEIIVSEMEHHSNLVPWQMVAKAKKAILKIIPIDDKGELDLTAYKKLFTKRTVLVSVAHVSNSTGTINPIEEIIALAHENKALCLIDGAQGAPHIPIDLEKMNADFYVFSGHKIYGPTGVGILYGKYNILNDMPPVQGGGAMIEQVDLLNSTYQKPPLRFEAGTPMIAEVIGLKAALDYVDMMKMENIFSYERALMNYATSQLEKIPELKIIGTAKEKGAIISFIIRNIHPLDLGTLLNSRHVALRTGHHCAQPTMKKFNISSTARISFGLYNSTDEIDYFIEALKEVIVELKA